MDAEQQEIAGWLAGRVPQGWYAGTPEVRADREEIWIVGTLADISLGAEGTPEALAAARAGRVKQHREETREARVQIAREAERRFRRKVAWGAKCGDHSELFTHLALPMMTRLRLPEREVLDVLVDAGVARSRSHALALCVRLVGKNQSEWVKQLKDAMAQVDRVRAQGPLN